MSVTKTIFLSGIALIAYGYLCRLLNIYFFWDSKTIGWIVLLIALVSYLFDLRRSRRRRGKKTIWVKIGICFFLFGLMLLPFVFFELKTSDAYQSAVEYLSSDLTTKSELGNIKGFGLVPTGSVQTITINGAQSGEAYFDLIVKGDKKYKDVTVYLTKTPDLFWTVTSVR